MHDIPPNRYLTTIPDSKSFKLNTLPMDVHLIGQFQKHNYMMNLIYLGIVIFEEVVWLGSVSQPRRFRLLDQTYRHNLLDCERRDLVLLR